MILCIRNSLLTLAVLLTGVTAFAQETANFPPPKTPVEVKAVRAGSAIKIDGVLDEADWQNAPVAGDFFRVEPNQGGLLRYATEGRFLYDPGVFVELLPRFREPG